MAEETTKEEHDKLLTDLLFNAQLAGRYFDFNKNGNPINFYPERVSKDLQKVKSILTMRDSLEIYIYNEKKGHYERCGKQLLRELINKMLGVHYREARAVEIIHKITASTGKDRKELDPPLHLIPLKNGLLNISHNKPKLEKHTPAMFFTGTLPINYDSEQECPKIQKFIEDILPSEIDRYRLQEHVGYLLYRKYIFQIAVLLTGPEDSGKSTFLALLRQFLGKENVASVALQDLGDDRFASAELYHKYANICADISKFTIRNSGVFKTLTGGDLLDAQRKHKPRFRFVNYAKLWFSANELPDTKDKTNAFFKRWDIFEFPNQFKLNCDPNIIDKLTTPNELSGFLNWALEGLTRLLENGKFTKLKTLEQRKEIWLLGSSSLYKFVSACVEEDVEFYETKDGFYSEYVKFCRNHNLNPVDKRVVTRELPRLIPDVRTWHPTVGGKQVKGWKGIRIVGERPWQNI